jgi:hypothetical protein
MVDYRMAPAWQEKSLVAVRFRGFEILGSRGPDLFEDIDVARN